MERMPPWLPLLLNAAALLVPIVGIGSLVGGQRWEGRCQIGLWALAIVALQVLAFGFSATDTLWIVPPLLVLAGAYLWSLVTGVRILVQAREAR